MKGHLLSLLLVQVAFTPALVQAEVLGRTVAFQSPNGVTERCIALNPMPGAIYKPHDAKEEDRFCAVNLYDNSIGMCPKVRSTSPGTYLYVTDGKVTSAQLEADCGHAHMLYKKIAKFKNTMNADTTSATFSNSSLLYYAFSRYFNTEVEVPVSVYRTIDKDEHATRVSANGTGRSKFILSAWDIMRKAEADPTTYKPTDDLFTPDRKAIYGIMLESPGTTYGAEINGDQDNVTGKQRNLEFQKTPAFTALRAQKDLMSSIQDGLATIPNDPKMVKALETTPIPPMQMVSWMRELSEIAILDHIFNQQDRVGNVDAIWMWAYVDGGQVKYEKMRDKTMKTFDRQRMFRIKPPAELVAFRPTLIQRTTIADNDAGGKPAYVNFSRITGMVANLRHISPDTYRRALALAHDFKTIGPDSVYLATTFGLTQLQTSLIEKNAIEVAQILQTSCHQGLLRFDLDPEQFLLTGHIQEAQVNCDTP